MRVEIRNDGEGARRAEVIRDALIMLSVIVSVVKMSRMDCQGFSAIF